MKTVFKIPSPADVVRLLEASMPTEGFHIRPGLCTQIANAVGHRHLTPVQIAEAVHREFADYSRNFEQSLLEKKRTLLPLIIKAFVLDKMSALQAQLIVSPHHIP